MLNWWLGRPGDGAERVPGADPDAEAPETPAPVFAARALKSAFFGTPGVPRDDTLYGIEKEEDTMFGRDNRLKTIVPSSPTKPPGILMTPGTGTTRRKTVSFGSEVVDNEGREGPQKINRTATPYNVKLSSFEAFEKEKLSQPTKKTTLMKTLEDSRGTESSVKKHSQFSTAQSTQIKDKDQARSDMDVRGSRKSRILEDEMSKNDAHVVDDGDITVDINEPRSQSGKFWKSEFQRYHDEAQAQMKQLVRYKQLAKSYAKKKDAEALDLAEKLKEEQHKVAMMENNISELMLQIAEDGKVGGDASPDMMRDLARQTALAFQYRVQVEEFRKAVEGDGTLAAALPKCESRNAKNDPNEVRTLREELEKARQALATMERTTSKLREENNMLSQDLIHSGLRFKKHTESYEKRLKSAEEQRHRKDERLHSLQKDYDHAKQTAKNKCRELERLLRKRHDQVVELKKEIASLKTAQSQVQDLQQSLDKMSTEHEQVIQAYKKEIAHLKEGMANTDAEPHKMAYEFDRLNLFGTAGRSAERINSPSGILLRTDSLTKPARTVTSIKSTSEAPAESTPPRLSHAALSEITNYATSEKFAFQKAGKVDYTPLSKRFTDLSLESQNLDTTSAGPSVPLLPQRTSHEAKCMVSPRPKIFNIPSSPPRATIAKSRATGQLKLNNESVSRRDIMASSRLSSMGGSKRCALPPDRVAAAKARLAQKNAEKRRARALGAENIR